MTSSLASSWQEYKAKLKMIEREGKNVSGCTSYEIRIRTKITLGKSTNFY